VRIAGDGDPTLAGDELPDLIGRCKTIPQIGRVTLTTNSILLGQMAKELKAAGLDSVTVSLNSLSRLGYQRYSGHDSLDRVLSSISVAHAAGLRLKVNLIYTRWNQDEIDAFEALSCEYDGMPIKVFDLIPTAGENLFVPLSRVEEKLRPETADVIEQHQPYAKRTYRLKSGAVFEVKIAGSNNTCPMLNCPSRSSCLEGCRHSVRIGLDGWMRPCGVRTDNKVDLFNPATTDDSIRSALASGGKLQPIPADMPASRSSLRLL
jgi:cyclic pyranopterin phosphate synthase